MSETVVWGDGTKVWHQDDIVHRLDGPAVEDVKGNNQYFINNVEYTEEEFNKKIQEMKGL